MEESKKIDFSNRPSIKEENGGGIGGGSCPVWIFGNEKSADNDLKKKFEIADEDKNNK